MHGFSNLLFVNCVVLGYSSLDTSSTIRDLKLKLMLKYKQVWNWRTVIFVLCFWLAQNYMKICFRNINSAKFKWKECSKRIKYGCFFCILVGSSSISFSTTLDLFFLVFFFFANYSHLLSFSKDTKVVMSLTFAL